MKKYFFLAILFLFNCHAYKEIGYTREDSIKSRIIFSDKELIGIFKIDTIGKFNFKIYDVSGIKIVDLAISEDSLNIKYLIDNDLKENIQYYFNFSKSEISMYNLIDIIYNGFNLKVKRSYNFETVLSKFSADVILSSFTGNSTIKLTSNKFELKDSILYFKRVDLLLNNQFQFKISSFND